MFFIKFLYSFVRMSLNHASSDLRLYDSGSGLYSCEYGYVYSIGYNQIKLQFQPGRIFTLAKSITAKAKYIF